MPTANIIARTNGVGLDQDVDLVNHALVSHGFDVQISHCRGIPIWSGVFHTEPEFDVNIFIERVFPRWISKARINLLIPNQERFPRRQLRNLRDIDFVLCKSQHALDIFSKFSDTRYIGFTSTDRSLPEAKPDYHSCIHLAGRSTLKGTETLLELWKKHPHWPNLTLIQHEANAPKSVPGNVSLISRHLTKDELIQEMNRHGIHLCTSRSEGWGHYIVEAMSCRALVVTTDGPPMDEIVAPSTGVRVPYKRVERRHLGANLYVDADALARTLDHVFNMSRSEKIAYGSAARDWFEKNHTEFSRRFPETIQSLIV